ncbi:MAG TPA: ABC transporter ATP-binding protein, partial [bacterium]|nr:ABC transporter ATP-binding protein [bacterium]
GSTDEKALCTALDFDPHKKTKNYSSGNKQKLGLIMALAHDPRLIVLDEPTTGLDPLLQHTIYAVLAERISKGRTAFISSHNLAEVEKICHRVCIIKNGKLVGTESIAELKKKRMYSVHVYFTAKTDEQSLLGEGIEIVERYDHGLQLRVRGEIGPVVEKLKGAAIKDLEITHASLEEIFMEFYAS